MPEIGVLCSTCGETFLVVEEELEGGPEAGVRVEITCPYCGTDSHLEPLTSEN